MIPVLHAIFDFFRQGKENWFAWLNIGAAITTVSGVTLAGLATNVISYPVSLLRGEPTLSGKWRFVDYVATSSVPGFVGHSLEFNASIKQIGENLEGFGRKVSSDRKMVVGSECSEIVLYGIAKSHSVFITVTEVGPSHKIFTVFTLQRTNDNNQLIGDFQSSHSSTAGSSKWSREEKLSDFHCKMTP